MLMRIINEEGSGKKSINFDVNVDHGFRLFPENCDGQESVIATLNESSYR